MNNLLKSEFSKLFKQKVFYIASVVIVLLGAFISFLFYAVISLANDNLINAAGGDSDDLAALKDLDGVNFSVIAISFVHIIGIMLIVILAIYIANEFTNRTIKNPIIKGYSRVKVYLSKLIPSYFVVLCLAVLFEVSSVVVATLLWGKGALSKTDTIGMIKSVSLELFLYLGLVSFFVALAMILQSNGLFIGISLTILILISGGFSAADNFLGDDANTGKYWIVTAIEDSGLIDISNADIITGLIVGTIYIVIPTLIGIIYFRKHDLK